ncbi:hypothetical protein RWH45_06545 [Microbacterium sp. KSW4-17]|uniref:Uncharacterized protein n=1 Tax=Microbacterium galbum TaxID=3075994 RepID=A0ABU3T676_9MICO|nr:hypothetical protein [Microbacterium sp. KSW4-17]MDU0366868.1 hypothetical protein [Microbacterium sp. KSW4-17]
MAGGMVAGIIFAGLSVSGASASTEAILTEEDAAIAAQLGASALAAPEQEALVDEWEAAKDSLQASVELGSGLSDVQHITLSNGTTLSVGVEPVSSPAAEGSVGARALTGNYKIWGSNGFAYMEYYVTFGASGSYTTVIGSPRDMVIQLFATTKSEGKWFTVPRRTETSSAGAWVRGWSRFTYPNNVATLEGGVEGFARNNNLVTSLF